MEIEGYTLWFKHLGSNEVLYFSKKPKGSKFEYRNQGDYWFFKKKNG